MMCDVVQRALDSNDSGLTSFWGWEGRKEEMAGSTGLCASRRKLAGRTTKIKNQVERE